MAKTELTENELFEAFEYLDELRESGVTNMFGAPAYVESDLGWTKKQSMDAAMLWMSTFDDELTMSQRVEKALAEG
jgi:hypothetical protein